MDNRILVLKLPTIPKSSGPEMYQYFISLHANLKAIEDAINNMKSSVTEINKVITKPDSHTFVHM